MVQHTFEPDERSRPFYHYSHFLQLFHRVDSMVTVDFYNSPGSYRSDSRHAQQVGIVGFVYIYRKKPGLVPGYHQLGVSFQGKVAIFPDGQFDFLRRKIIFSEEPLCLIEPVLPRKTIRLPARLGLLSRDGRVPQSLLIRAEIHPRQTQLTV